MKIGNREIDNKHILRGVHMKRLGKVVVLVLVALVIVSCAAAPVLPPDYSYGRGEIQINVSADPRLNLYEGRAHTLLLCVHQLRDPNAFNRLAGDRNGIYKLLECSQFDQSVTQSKRLIVRPGQVEQYTLDRAEGTKYVGIAGGYYNVRENDVIRLFEIPVHSKSMGFLSGASVAVPGKLSIDLDLGPQAIRTGGGP